MNTHENTRAGFSGLFAVLLLILMAALAGGAALRESVTVDEVSHIGAGVSYLQKLDLRMNPEHPPLPKILAAAGTIFNHFDLSVVQSEISLQRRGEPEAPPWLSTADGSRGVVRLA